MSLTNIPLIRIPFVAVEIDNSNAQQGPTLQEYTVGLIGQKLSTGTAVANQKYSVTSDSQADELFGEGSMLAAMVKKYRANNKVTRLRVIPLDDAGAAVAATGSQLLAGTATRAGTANLRLAGRAYQAAVDSGDTAAEVVSALVAVVQADANRLVNAAINGSTPEQLDFSARHAGEVYNDIDFRFNYFDGEELPQGISLGTKVAMAGGTANPDVASAIAAIGDEQFNVIINPYLDASNMAKLETELDSRFGPLVALEGQLVSAKAGDFSTLSTLGNTRNSRHNSIAMAAGPTPAFEWASAMAGQIALNGQIDPARPFQTLTLSGVDAPEDSEQLDDNERNLLLFDGISTNKVQAGGVVAIERMITTFQTNAFGSPDTSYLNLNSLLTLSYLRFDFRAQWSSKFPRHKLADDSGRAAPGQPIMTPKLAKSFAVDRFRAWERLGLVENIDQFKRDLIVQRSDVDPDRIEFLLPPDLINQLRVAAASMQFLS